MNTDTVTGPQNLQVSINCCGADTDRMFKAKVEGDTKTKRTTAHKDRQSITKVHQNN